MRKYFTNLKVSNILLLEPIIIYIIVKKLQVAMTPGIINFMLVALIQLQDKRYVVKYGCIKKRVPTEH